MKYELGTYCSSQFVVRDVVYVHAPFMVDLHCIICFESSKDNKILLT